ncbi:unnamed protein product [Phaeothamnion confervicola]
MRASSILLLVAGVAASAASAPSSTTSSGSASVAPGSWVVRVRGGATPAAKAPALKLQAEKAKAAVVKTGAKPGLLKRLEVPILFLCWYVLNIGYNITNKAALKLVTAPWTIATIQLLVGAAMVIPLWFTKLRKAPKLDKPAVKTLTPIAFCHMASHASAVIGLGAGAVSFVHIVKAMEPFFTAFFSAVFLRQIFPIPVYLALIPVVGGVGIASLHDLSFNWVAFGGAMGSNLAASIRAIFAKRSMGKPQGENMTPANLYAVLTIMAAAMLLPLAAVFEGSRVMDMWDAALAKGADPWAITKNVLASGAYFYLYNEVAFLCLDKVHPVTHAVANTFKRVFLIMTGVLVFKDKFSAQSAYGSGVAVVAVLVYSMLKDYYAKKVPFFGLFHFHRSVRSNYDRAATPLENERTWSFRLLQSLRSGCDSGFTIQKERGNWLDCPASCGLP